LTRDYIQQRQLIAPHQLENFFPPFYGNRSYRTQPAPASIVTRVSNHNLSPWLSYHHSPNTTLVKQHYYPNPRTSTSSTQSSAASMISLLPTRKRKDTPNRRWGSREKDKRRVIEHSGQDLIESTAKPVQRRTTTPAGRTFTNFRKSSIRIFSLLRGGKGEFRSTVYLATR
jgi:hypothetical protein